MKLLHLEDDPLDCELTGLMCSGQWPDCQIVPATNRQSYVSALRNGGFDGIVSDSGVAGLEGPEALALARQFAPSVPFLFLCGAMDEVKRAALLAGKPDGLVCKDHPEEVVNAFRRLFRREA